MKKKALQFVSKMIMMNDSVGNVLHHRRLLVSHLLPYEDPSIILTSNECHRVTSFCPEHFAIRVTPFYRKVKWWSLLCNTGMSLLRSHY